MPVRSFFVLGFDILMVADSRLVWVIVLPCICSCRVLRPYRSVYIACFIRCDKYPKAVSQKTS